MKVIIDIPKDFRAEMFEKCFSDSVILPDNPTNGDMIKAMFNCMVIDITNGKVYVEKIYFPFNEDWWNAPYKGGEENGKQKNPTQK